MKNEVTAFNRRPEYQLVAEFLGHVFVHYINIGNLVCSWNPWNFLIVTQSNSILNRKAGMQEMAL